MINGKDDGTETAIVRVSLECGSSLLDLMVPTDTPVASLVPDLLRSIYGEKDAEFAAAMSWGLGFPDGQPFPSDSTLADYDVGPGTALRLDEISLWEEASSIAESPRARTAAPPPDPTPPVPFVTITPPPSAEARPPDPGPPAQAALPAEHAAAPDEAPPPDPGPPQPTPDLPPPASAPSLASASPQPPRPAARLASPEAGPPDYRAESPSRRTKAALPRRVGFLGRSGLAVGSALRRRRAAARKSPGGLEPGETVMAADLTRERPPGIPERVGASWRSSDYLNRLDAAIQAPQLRRCATIAVMSPKGGVGKTTLTALIGSLFAMLRQDRIVAVDNDPDFGSLGRTLVPQHMVFVDEMLEVLDYPELTVTELDAHLGRGAHGIMVLPSPVDPARMARLDEEAYTRVIRRLQDMVGLVILDCGTGLYAPASRAAVRTADQILLITDAEPATASLVTEAAALLMRERMPVWLVVNKLPHRETRRLDLAALERYIPNARGLVTVPFEARAAAVVAAGAFDWRDAPDSWRRSIREVAADLVAGWPGLDVTV